MVYVQRLKRKDTIVALRAEKATVTSDGIFSIFTILSILDTQTRAHQFVTLRF